MSFASVLYRYYDVQLIIQYIVLIETVRVLESSRLFLFINLSVIGNKISCKVFLRISSLRNDDIYEKKKLSSFKTITSHRANFAFKYSFRL